LAQFGTQAVLKQLSQTASRLLRASLGRSHKGIW
jgi:hypothetical protein